MLRVDSKNILDYLPHREPMVMLDGAEIQKDGVSEHSGKVVYGTLSVKETNWFYVDGVLTESGLMEHMAQSVCLRLTIDNAQCTMSVDNAQCTVPDSPVHQIPDSPKIGYLAEIKNMTISRLPILNEQLRTRIEVVAVVDEAIVVSAETQVNTETIAKGMLTIFVPPVEEERRAQ